MPNNGAGPNLQNENFLIQTIRAALEAGDAILEIYQTDFTVDYKQDDSPLTQADRAAHKIIMRHLQTSGIPILSEEGKALPVAERRSWQTLWIVDPLDGTKEFIKKNGEFTVNIALVTDGTPIMGVVYAPDRQRLYFSMQILGAYMIDDPISLKKISQQLAESETKLTDLIEQAQQLPLVDDPEKPYTIVGSRSHATPELEQFVAAKREEYGQVEFIPAGSSLKICLVAEGKADIYPRLGPTMEWDTAAGHAVAQSAGARIFEHESGEPLQYNKENLLNPWFVVERSTK
jgi:3'(2'), 5'-bisphosphate nucleotidase